MLLNRKSNSNISIAEGNREKARSALTNVKLEQQSSAEGMISSGRIILTFLAWLALYFICIQIDYNKYYSLPIPLGDDVFNKESITRTRDILDSLSSITPRIAGTKANELDAKEYILRTLNRIKSSDISKDLNFEIDVQHPSGSFFVEYLYGFTNIYHNITNVIVRLSPKDMNLKINEVSPPAVLVNAHFDSFVMSSGASDDGIAVAVMLEVLRLMSRSNDQNSLRNPVIFLFNGAEESNLQAAHGFITQHVWAKSIRAVVNLEAIGSGGKELVFQCNSPWLISLYGKHVPYPHSTSIAHELFQQLLWRVAATDWRAFVQFGPPGIVGTDSAYTENGYVYHTSFDTSDAIPDGTILHTGNNLYHFLTKLSEAPEISLSLDRWIELNNFKLSPSGDVVNKYDSHFMFYSLLGYFHFTYVGVQIYCIHLSIAMVALYLCWLRLPDLKGLCAMALHSWYIGLRNTIVSLLFSLMYSSIAPMRWYSEGAIFCTIIYLPIMFLSELSAPRWSLDKAEGKRLSHLFASAQAQQQVYREISGLLHWSSILFLTTLVGHKGSYLFLIWSIFGTIAQALRINLSPKSAELQTSSTGTGSGSVFVESLCGLALLFPTIIWMQYIRSTLALVVPLLGKTGSVLNGDIVIAALMSYFLGSFFRLPVLNLYRLSSCESFLESIHKRILAFLGLLIGAILLYSALYSYSYTNERPKRLWVYHLTRDLTGLKEGVDSGLWVIGFDGQGLEPLKTYSTSPNFSGKYKTSSFRGSWFAKKEAGAGGKLPDYNKHMKGFNCAVADGECYTYWPYYFPVAEALLDSFYIPAEEISFHKPVPGVNLLDESDKSLQLAVHSKAADGVSSHTRQLSLLVSGPSHMTLILKDNHMGKRIKKWGFLQNSNSASKQSFLNEEIRLVDPSPTRPEGVQYVQVGFGLCDGECLLRVEILVHGSELIDLSVYGHYVLMRNSSDLQALSKDLPPWSVGAEWTYFSSKIIATQV